TGRLHIRKCSRIDSRNCVGGEAKRISGDQGIRSACRSFGEGREKDIGELGYQRKNGIITIWKIH
ncbi:MAG: hypothetical protein AABZ57_06260, partial [Candidatus Margulisiibacteriota bacterium]